MRQCCQRVHFRKYLGLNEEKEITVIGCNNHSNKFCHRAHDDEQQQQAAALQRQQLEDSNEQSSSRNT